MTPTTHSMLARSGALVVLGGEGMKADPDHLRHWTANFAPDDLRNVACLPTALAGQKIGTVERRSRLIFDRLGELTDSARLLELSSREEAGQPDRIELLEDASAYYFFGGEPRVLAATLIGTLAWKSIQRRHDAGVPVIAAGGAAAALGSIGIAPSQPYPADLAELFFEPFAGLGLLPDAVVLPYLSWLPDRLIDKVRGAVPPATRIVGLDDQVILIWDGSQWYANGLGSITIWDADGQRRITNVGQPIPTDWLPPQRKADYFG